MDYLNSDNNIDVNLEYTRKSILQIKSRLQYTSRDADDETEGDRQWRLSYLKLQFNTPDLQHLFNFFFHRLNQSFFALLMMVQVVIFGFHFFIILMISRNNWTQNILDLSLYAFMFLISMVLLCLTDGPQAKLKKPNHLTIFNLLIFVLLHIVNVGIPVYYFFKYDIFKISPAYSTHIIISCYVFFCFRKLYLTIILGLISSVIHLLVVTFLTYKDIESEMLLRRIFSDCIYLLCINGLGIYYRYLDEIIKRRSFLDRRAMVLNKRHLSFQKKQEEQLMSTLIPSYVLDNVKERLLKNLDNFDNMEGGLRNFVFKTDETKTYTNVTILYADVVNYTEMTVKLNIEDLLETLNDLFGAFDDESVAHKVMRIKFLGDCYYCVSGLPPNPPKNHAEACVDLGLKMINIISNIRKKRNVNINMRIGIHTGNIISGIIGYQKMHFDIWSQDVILANQMETEGEAGKVHITNTTKNLLEKRYNIEETNKSETVQNFKKLGIKTYLISPEDTDECDDRENVKSERRITFMKGSTQSSTSKSNIQRYSKTFKVLGQSNDEEENLSNLSYTETSNTFDRRNTRGGRNTLQRLQSEDRKSSDDGKRRLAPMNSNIQQYKDTMKETYVEMEKAIESVSLTKYEQWFRFKEIKPFSIMFSNKSYELKFLTLRDPLFKYYLVAELILLVFLFIMQNLTLEKWNWNSWWIYSTMAIICFIFLPMAWINDFCKKKDSQLKTTHCISYFSYGSKIITDSIYARLIIYLVVCILFTLCVFSEMIHCIVHFNPNEEQTETRSLLAMLTTEKNDEICTLPWHMTQTCAMAIIMSFLFLKMFSWIKFIYSISVAVVYSYTILNYSGNIFKGDQETYNPHLSTAISHILTVIFLSFTLHIIDRQSEYMNRLDFLLNENLKEEQTKVESRYIVNKMLLINVLPEHLADMYLDVMNPPAALYHEKYNNAAVMFATVTGLDKTDMDDQSLIKVMSEIIGDFDKLILQSCIDDYPIEKIKVAKWTYMAASGILPGFGEDASRNEAMNLEVLLKFASAMMRQLHNKKYIEGIGLRVGIANGSIVAGVVGKKKPLYDIWGDPVNMASRMDTTGEINKIHVLEKTAKTLQGMGYKCKLKGITKVKGLPNPVPTYFVNLDDNFQFIYEENLILQNMK